MNYRNDQIRQDTQSHAYLHRALCPILGTVYHLNGSSPNAPRHHHLSHLRQSRTRQNLASILSASILGSAPQNLCCSTSPWPKHVIKVDAVSLLAPEVNFTAKDEVARVGRHAAQWVIRIHVTPILDWGTVVGKWVGVLGYGTLRKVKPLAFAAVKKLEHVMSVNEASCFRK